MMNGATLWMGSLSRTAKQALLAGNDIIMISRTPFLYDPVWTFLINSMKEDEEFRQCVRSAARRILVLKLKYLRGKRSVPYVPDLAKVANELPDPAGSNFFMNLAARSVTIVKPSPAGSVFPLTREKAGHVLLTGRYGDFFTAGKAAFPNAVIYRYSDSGEAPQMASFARNADTVIFCLADTIDLRVLHNLELMNKKVIILSVLSPVHIENVPWVNGAVAVYSYAPESFAAGFSAIIGKIPAKGTLPYE
jgi:beta-N-acetylhexosaminidase